MYIGLLHTHSFLRWILLIMLIWGIVDALTGYFNNQPFENKNNRLNLIAFITAHLQFLAGIILYLVSPVVKNGLLSMSTAMKTPELRFYVVEHGLTMTIAIALITIGRITAKKAPSDRIKYKRLAIYNIIALVLILSMIPWDRGLF